MATASKRKIPSVRKPAAGKADRPGNANLPPDEQRRSVRLAAAGLQTASDVADFMLAVAGEVIIDQCKPQAASAASSAIGKALKAVELQMKYGKQLANGSKVLNLGHVG